MTRIAVLGKDGVTGQAVIARLEKEKDLTYSDDPLQADLIVASPGIPVSEYPQTETEIISEIELAYRLNRSKVIAISGTNGKTTTTTLIAQLLNIPAVGNIGSPYISVAEKFPYLAVEVSSYQLETIKTFRPHIAVILNITPDHLQRHQTLENYARIKARLYENQDENDYLIYNQNDPLVTKYIARAKSQKFGFQAEHPYQQNFQAARIAAKICGKSDQEIEKFFKNFKGVEHRFERVGTFNNIEVVNDSKATNVDSTLAALSNFSDEKKVILIAGGQDKNTDLSPLKKMLAAKVKELILLGEAQQRFAQGLNNVPQSLVSNYEEAVQTAFAKAAAGDTILLSPACASWDMFENYEKRGEYFKELVKKHGKHA